ncbi:MAG TPA: DUF1801 domain-containing protein [Desertimonas sp.]|nr:DUF1801 domain-containing protein [Desertimonas sp.]
MDTHAPGSQLDDTAVASFLARFDDRVQQLARAALGALRAVLPDGIESAEGGEIGIGDAAGYKGLVFTVSPQSTYVNVGIAGGASLDDPAGLLEGTGKVHRHLKIRRADKLDDERVQALLRQAVAARRPR